MPKSVRSVKSTSAPLIRSHTDDAEGDMIDYAKVVSSSGKSIRSGKGSASEDENKRPTRPRSVRSNKSGRSTGSKRSNRSKKREVVSDGTEGDTEKEEEREPEGEGPKGQPLHRSNSFAIPSSARSSKIIAAAGGSSSKKADESAVDDESADDAVVAAPKGKPLHRANSFAIPKAASIKSGRKGNSDESDVDPAPKKKAAAAVKKPSAASSSDDKRSQRETSTATFSSGEEGRVDKTPKRASTAAPRAASGIFGSISAVLFSRKEATESDKEEKPAATNGADGTNGATSDVLSDSDAAPSISKRSTRSTSKPRSVMSDPDTIFNSSAGESEDDEEGQGRYAPGAKRPAASVKSVRSRRPSSVRSGGSRRSSRSGKPPSVKKYDDSDDERATLRDVNGEGGRIAPKQRSGSQALTAYDRHYINKALTVLQMQREWSALGEIGELTMYGEPFLNHPTGPRSKPGAGEKKSLFGLGKKKTDTSTMKSNDGFGKPLQPVILHYQFWRYIMNFPGLKSAPESFWQQRIQPFFDSFAERNLSSTRERSETTKRRLLALAFTRILGTYTATSVTAMGESLPSRPDSKMMRRVDALFPGSQDSMFKLLYRSKAKARGPRDGPGYASWVAIVENARGREGDEDYTILTTVLAGRDRPLFCVIRSYGAFDSFAGKLKKIAEKHGDIGVPILPPEDKLGPPDRITLQRYLRLVVLHLSNPPEALRDSPGLGKARVQLERFLLDAPEKLSSRRKREYLDTAEKDDKQAERERRLWVKSGERIRSLRTIWCQYRDALIAGDELNHSFLLLKKYENVRDLPKMHADVEEWARVWVAYNLHFIFVSSPNAPEILNLLKSFHELVPYGLFKTALRIVNPTFMIKTLVNIVFGQPMGQLSLFARVFSIIMGRDIKARQKDIDTLRAELGDDDLADRLKAHVYSPRGEQQDVRRAAYENAEDMIFAIFSESGVSEKRIDELERGREDYLAQGGSVDLAGGKPRGHGAEEYYLLKQILRAYCLKRDREQVLEIALEPNTPTLIKSIISVYYNGIYRIAEACHLADRLGDLQRFFDDIIQTTESSDHSTAAFIKLTERNDQSLWMLFHEMHAYGGDLLDPIKQWSKSGLEYIRKGVPAVNRAGGGRGRRLGLDVDGLMDDVDEETRTKILYEMRGLAQYTRIRKVFNDIFMRCDHLEVHHGIKLNPNDVFAQLAIDPDIASYVKRYGRKDRVRAEDVVHWAWWAEEDILDDGNDIRTDWKAEYDRAGRLAKETRDAGGRDHRTGRHKSLKRAKSSASVHSGEGGKDLGATDLIPPPPRLIATKSLIAPYVKRIHASLQSARENKISACAQVLTLLTPAE